MTLNEKTRELEKTYNATFVINGDIFEKYADVEIDKLPLRLQKELTMMESNLKSASLEVKYGT